MRQRPSHGENFESVDMNVKTDSLPRIFVIASLVALLASSAVAELSRKTLDRIEFDVIPAYEIGDTTLLLESLSTLTFKLDAEELEEVDSELQAQGIPPAADLLTNSRMLLIQQGITNLPPAHQREILMAIPFLRDSVENIVCLLYTSDAADE